MGKISRSCLICKENYSYCPHCGSTTGSWNSIFCSENCREIYITLNDYEGNRLSKTETRKKLDNLDISKRDRYLDKFKKLLSDFDEEKKERKNTTRKTGSSNRTKTEKSKDADEKPKRQARKPKKTSTKTND